MRSPADYIFQRVGGFKISEVARRCVPCYKNVVESDGSERLALCMLIDHYNLYLFPYEDPKTNSGIAREATGMRGLELKVKFITAEMEHLRLREFQPGFCRYVNPRHSGKTA